MDAARLVVLGEGAVQERLKKVFRLAQCFPLDRTYALNARTGHLLWTYGDGQYSPVVADSKRLYLVGHAKLYGLAQKP